MLAAVSQMVSSSLVNRNLSELPSCFVKAVEAGAQLIVLPENFAFMGKHETDKWFIAEDYGVGLIQQTVALLAKKFKIWVIAGTQPIKTDGTRVRSSCMVYDDRGACVARYDKIHLFDVRVSANEAHEESLTIEGGMQPVVIDTPIGRVGLSVCYDLRFPELYRRMEEDGAEIFAVPAAFTFTTGAAHWEILLRARAIENLCYVLAANQGGVHDNGRKTYGHSMIIDPWGSVLIEQNGVEPVITAEINLQRLRQLRKQFPCNEHHVLKTEIK